MAETSARAESCTEPLAVPAKVDDLRFGDPGNDRNVDSTGSAISLKSFGNLGSLGSLGSSFKSALNVVLEAGNEDMIAANRKKNAPEPVPTFDRVQDAATASASINGDSDVSVVYVESAPANETASTTVPVPVPAMATGRKLSRTVGFDQDMRRAASGKAKNKARSVTFDDLVTVFNEDDDDNDVSESTLASGPAPAPAPAPALAPRSVPYAFGMTVPTAPTVVIIDSIDLLVYPAICAAGLSDAQKATLETIASSNAFDTIYRNDKLCFISQSRADYFRELFAADSTTAIMFCKPGNRKDLQYLLWRLRLDSVQIRESEDAVKGMTDMMRIPDFSGVSTHGTIMICGNKRTSNRLRSQPGSSIIAEDMGVVINRMLQSDSNAKKLENFATKIG